MTMYEDQGQNILDTLLNANTATVDLQANQDQLNSSVAKMDADPVVKWNQAMSDMKTAMAPVLSTIADLVGKIAEWIKENPTLAATITAIAIALGILTGVIIALTPVVLGLATAAGALSIGMGPLILIIIGVMAAIAALIGIGVLLYKNWDKIIAWLANVWKTIKEAGIAAWEALKTGIQTAMTAIGDFLTSIWEGIKTGISTALTAIQEFILSIWESIKAGTIAAWNAIVDFVVGAFSWLYDHNYYFQALVDAIVVAWEWLKNTTINIWNALTTWISTVWNEIKNAAIAVWEGIKSALSIVWNSIKSMATSVWDAIKSAVTSVWNPIKSVITGAMDTVKKAISSGFNSAKSVVSDVVNSIKTMLGGLADQATNWGKNLLSMFISGVKSKISALVDILKDAAGKVSDFLGFHSPTKEGPASDSDKWAPNFMDMFVKGIRAKIPQVQEIAGKMANGLNPADQKVSVATPTYTTVAQSGNTFQFVFNGDLYGSNPNELAKKLTPMISVELFKENQRMARQIRQGGKLI